MQLRFVPSLRVRPAFQMQNESAATPPSSRPLRAHAGNQTPHGFIPLLTAAPGQRTTAPRNGPRAPEGSGGGSRPPTGPHHTGARVGVKSLTLRRHNHRALSPVGKEKREGRGRKAREGPSGAQGRASLPFYLSRCVKRWRQHRRPPQAPPSRRSPLPGSGRQGGAHSAPRAHCACATPGGRTARRAGAGGAKRRPGLWRPVLGPAQPPRPRPRLPAARERVFDGSQVLSEAGPCGEKQEWVYYCTNQRNAVRSSAGSVASRRCEGSRCGGGGPAGARRGRSSLAWPSWGSPQRVATSHQTKEERLRSVMLQALSGSRCSLVLRGW